MARRKTTNDSSETKSTTTRPRAKGDIKPVKNTVKTIAKSETKSTTTPPAKKKPDRTRQAAALRSWNAKHNVKKTPDLLLKICADIADGNSIRQITQKTNMPDKSTIFKWLRDDPDFREMYNIAKTEGADALFEQMLDEAMDDHGDILQWEDSGKMVMRPNNANVQRSKLRIDTIKWRISQLNPKQYGDRVKIAGDDENPVKIETTLSKMSDEELVARIKGYERQKHQADQESGEHIVDAYDDVNREIDGETSE